MVRNKRIIKEILLFMFGLYFYNLFVLVLKLCNVESGKYSKKYFEFK